MLPAGRRTTGAIVPRTPSFTIMSRESSFIFIFHAGFFLIAGIVLLPLLKNRDEEDAIPGHDEHHTGHSVSALILGWNFSFYLASVWYEQEQLLSFWVFLAKLSAVQIFPDWFLVKMGTLHFPDDGAWKVHDDISWYMGGMWTIPLLWVLSSCYDKESEFASAKNYIWAGIASLIIFGLAEFLLYPLNLWQMTNAVQHSLFGHVAIYVLPAECLLGPTTLFAYSITKDKGWLQQWIGAVMTMLVYTGSLAIGFLVVEKL